MEQREFWLVNADNYFFKVQDFLELSVEEIKEIESNGIKVFYDLESVSKYLISVDVAYVMEDVDGFEVFIESDLEGGWTALWHGHYEEFTDLIDYLITFEC